MHSMLQIHYHISNLHEGLILLQTLIYNRDQFGNFESGLILYIMQFIEYADFPIWDQHLRSNPTTSKV